ncbi:MAG: SDR family oxidoreductase [Acidisphaera sp.]|nr:SDR family oxidoreductase [Acidisphaera sp.]MBV9813473.1 SDR family oxidoreductase [Acetobacteraceae bacterium]
MILITGASGTTGGAVLDAARSLGLPLRAMVRTADDARNLGAGVDVAVADFADSSSLAPALAGVDAVFLVCGPVPQLVELERGMIAACVSSGVRHVVLSSAIGADEFPKSFPSWHGKVEAALRESGLAYTIVRPNGFMQNIVGYYGPTIRSEGAFHAAMGEAKVSMVDVRDVGACAAAVLREPERHAGRVVALNGPEAVSCDEIAARISRLVGRKVAFVDLPEQTQRRAMLTAGMPEWQVTAVLELQEYYRTGRCATLDDTIAGLTGHPARRLDAYLSENAAAFTN